MTQQNVDNSCPVTLLVLKNTKKTQLNNTKSKLEEQAGKIKEIIESINVQNEDLSRYAKEQKSTQQEIEERKSTIKEKTTRINLLKKKKQEL